jgi:glycosyltransferase involved in cell wall biosynthesis
MKRTLFICDLHPGFGKVGSTMRTMNLVSFFRHFGSVDLCYSVSSPGAKAEDSPFSNEYFLKKADLPRGLEQHLARFLKGVPYPIREYDDESQRLLTSLIGSGSYDYILVRYIFNAGGLARLKKQHRQRMIIDFDDIISGSLYGSFFYPTGNPVRKFLRGLNKKLLENYENRSLQVGASLFCSEKDRARVGGETKENTFVVPNIYEDGWFGEYGFGDGFQNTDTLLFVGALSYGPNLEGLKWFLTSVYDELKRRHPNITLLVVGRSPAREIVELCGTAEGIELHADAPDIREYYRKCRAVVVPLLTGGGTRIKILEAALAGRPVLATPVGAEGLDFQDGTDLLLFENAREFCTMYDALLDMNKYESIVENAGRVVRAKYSAKVFAEAMKRVVAYLDRS